MPKLSVLVAVYNAADYLDVCMDSLRSQTLRDIEIICIDDASTDGSAALLRKHAGEDSRVKIVTLEKNGGQAHARNVGLRQATGAYVAFVDSDDWLSADALEKAASVFDNHPATGAVLFRVCFHEGNRQWDYPMPPFTTMSCNEAFEASLTWQIHGVYVVRADIHHRYPYDETCRSYSDDNTTRLHYMASEEVRCCEGVYHYRQHAASTSHQVSVRRFDYLAANASMKRQMEQLAADERLIDLYENVRWLNLVDVYWFYYNHRSELSAADRRYGLEQLRRTWRSIELQRLTAETRRKFGYMPLHFSWCLFRLQEEAYFTLRRWLKGR